jgi:hypothetical protein
VIIHEFGHGYWYGLNANNEFEEAWLDEGLNTYSTGKAVAKAYGEGMISGSYNGIPLAWFLKLPEAYDYESDRALAIHITEFDPITTYSWKFYNRGSYGLNVYMRASTCLNTLERLVGEETWLRILRTFHMRLRYKHPHTQDFIDVVNEVTGRDFTWFFEELFFSARDFDYAVSSLNYTDKKKYVRGIFDIDGKKEEFTRKTVAEMEEKGPRDEKVYITQVAVRRLGEARIRGDAVVKLKVVFEDDSEEMRYWKGQERWKKFRFEKPVKPKYAQIDPENIWLIDSSLTNNSIRMKPKRSGVLKLTTQLLFLIQNYLQFVGSLI